MSPSSLPVVPTPDLPGRGTPRNPRNRFERLEVDREPWTLLHDPSPRTRFYRDGSKTVLVTNNSPDVGLSVGLNPYRGCEHGCVYCYARADHEYLGFSAGLDFETRIVVKADAPSLLRDALRRPSWAPCPIMLSGGTDPYQPVERRLRLTRRCLEVLAEARNPVGLITKNHGVTRDIDVLRELDRHDAVAVTLSVTTLRRSLQKIMEPRTSTPLRRLDAVRRLADAGIPVGVNLAPIVPGLNDEEIPAILEAAAEAGARWAGYILLRLPHGLKALFDDWLARHMPDRRERVLNRLRDAYGGRLYDARYGIRGKGTGSYAEQIKQLYRAAARKHGLDGPPPELSTAGFRRPSPEGQLDLFPQGPV
ncbi:MAG TPA: PA0069 family radical SAM protein [Longimicrobiales bacterium]|nr:PA0069 family radical SAM protein [Longimicrobiales bacterium]